MSEMEYRKASLKLSDSIVDDEQGIIEGYASVWDEIDSHNTRFIKGAFNRSLKERGVKLLWNHENGFDGKPLALIGKILDITEDDKGLFIRGQILKSVDKGREAWELIKEGIVTTLSFGFSSNKDNRGKDGIRQFLDVNLFEVSPVAFESQPLAKITAARYDDPDKESVDTEDRASDEFLMNLSGNEITQKLSMMPMVLQETIQMIWMSEKVDAEKLAAFKKAIADFSMSYLMTAKEYLKLYGESKRSMPSRNPVELELYNVCQERKITLAELAQNSCFSMDELRSLTDGDSIEQSNRLKTLSSKLDEAYQAHRALSIENSFKSLNDDDFKVLSERFKRGEQTDELSVDDIVKYVKDNKFFSSDKTQ